MSLEFKSKSCCSNRSTNQRTNTLGYSTQAIDGLDIVHEIAKHMRKLKLAASCRLADAKGKKNEIKRTARIAASHCCVTRHSAACRCAHRTLRRSQPWRARWSPQQLETSSPPTRLYRAQWPPWRGRRPAAATGMARATGWLHCRSRRHRLWRRDEEEAEERRRMDGGRR